MKDMNSIVNTLINTTDTEPKYKFMVHTKNCSKCGKPYNMMLTPDEMAKLESGMELTDIFANAAEIVREQITLDLCNDCYLEWRKENK